ncbi:hypothetical protein CsSME_00039461 [Camellia sinensis var. sinensis]
MRLLAILRRPLRSFAPPVRTQVLFLTAASLPRLLSCGRIKKKSKKKNQTGGPSSLSLIITHTPPTLSPTFFFILLYLYIKLMSHKTISLAQCLDGGGHSMLFQNQK